MFKNPSWEVVDNRLTKEFLFHNFAEAMVFANDVAALAEDLNHHPVITISMGKARISTSTHDAGDMVTNKDWMLAEQADVLYHARHATNLVDE